MLTGSGLQSVFETALLLHSVYGVPYLSWPTVRGSLRAALAAGFPSQADLLFGKDPQPSGAAAAEITSGYITVFDDLWVPGSAPTPLALDVLTVHHPDYYKSSPPNRVEAPTDFDQPTPVHFLTGRGKFLFALVAPDDKWRDYLNKLLPQALRFRGIGAKTSAGYGRFLLPIPPKASAS